MPNDLERSEGEARGNEASPPQRSVEESARPVELSEQSIARAHSAMIPYPEEGDGVVLLVGGIPSPAGSLDGVIEAPPPPPIIKLNFNTGKATTVQFNPTFNNHLAHHTLSRYGANRACLLGNFIANRWVVLILEPGKKKIMRMLPNFQGIESLPLNLHCHTTVYFTETTEGKISEHRLYVFGGCAGQREGDPSVETNALYCLDLNRQIWRKIPQDSNRTPTPRAYHAAAMVNNEWMYIFGGGGPSEQLNASGTQMETTFGDMWRFNIQQETWEKVSTTGNAPSPRGYLAMHAKGSHIFLYGGYSSGKMLYDLYCLNTNTHVWTCLKKQPETPEEIAQEQGQPSWGTAHCLINGIWHIATGMTGWESPDPQQPPQYHATASYRSFNLNALLQPKSEHEKTHNKTDERASDVEEAKKRERSDSPPVGQPASLGLRTEGFFSVAGQRANDQSAAGFSSSRNRSPSSS